METKTVEENEIPAVGSQQIELLERLCLANAVSGDEGEVRAIVLEQIRPYTDQIKVDALGNVLAVRKGRLPSIERPSKDRPLRVMVAAHMDEIGFMLVSDEGDGFYRFDVVGGIDVRQLVGKPVSIGPGHHPGVIGAKPIHLTKPDETKKKLPLESLRIDVGPARNKVKVGDRATFATPFTNLGPSVRGKALDNRLGVASLIELVKNPPGNIDVLAAFTVQEEIGLRGARVSAYTFDPDLAIAVDSTPANDLPAWDGSENTAYNTRLGGGPAIYLADSGTLSDPRLVRHFVDTAESRGIPYQIRQPGGGGTDAGMIHKQRQGIPSLSISVPGRYPHTPAGIARISDWENTLSLLYHGLAGLSFFILDAPR